MASDCTHPLGARSIHEADISGYDGDVVAGVPSEIEVSATCLNCDEPAPLKYALVRGGDAPRDDAPASYKNHPYYWLVEDGHLTESEYLTMHVNRVHDLYLEHYGQVAARE